MKASAEKSSSTVSRTTASRPFFAKAGGGDFFAPVNRAAVSAVQAKMTVGKTGDKFEREADKMADKVMRMPSPASSAKEEKVQRKTDERLQKKDETEKIQRAAQPEEKLQKAAMPEEKLQKKEKEEIQKAEQSKDKLQKKEENENIQKAALSEEQTQKEDEPSVPFDMQSVILSKTTGGQPLSSDTRSFMEPRFSADFGNVRVHNDAESAALSSQLSARAFTYQNHIFFSRDQYQPGISEGKELLAHELTHVIQQNTMLNRYSLHLQRDEISTDADITADDLIDNYTTLNFLDEEGLGHDLANRLPSQPNLTISILNELDNSDRDDVSCEITIALGGKLSEIDEGLRMRFVRELVGGFVSEEEEKAIAAIWESFKAQQPKVAERNRDIWKKSLSESEQLNNDLQPIVDSFSGDVIGLAIAYLANNKQVLNAEAGRYGIDLEGRSSIEPTHQDYINSVLPIARGVLKLKRNLDDLKELHVGYIPISDCLFGDCKSPVRFDPEFRPTYDPDKSETPLWPTWKEVKVQYDRVSALISAFANLYPTIYILIQQDKLDSLYQAGEAAKAQNVIRESMEKIDEKIAESNKKITSGKITSYDLKLIQSQLFEGLGQEVYLPKYPWNQFYYQDIAIDNVKGYEARQFWVDLGLSLVAAAALIAAPFTGGASAAFLVGFGVGIGAAQAGLSWDKYLSLSTLSDAQTKDELALVSKGEISAQLVDAIIQTVAVFLDVYGAKAATAAARTSREAIELAEKGLKEQLAEEARRRLLREAGKDIGLTTAGAGVAIGMHELSDDEPVPDMEAVAGQWQFDLGTEQVEEDSTTINRISIYRAPVPSTPPPTVTPKEPPILLSGGEFEEYVSKALLKGEWEGLPHMSWVIPGQYTGSGHGIDRIGIVFDEATGAVKVYHLEMKFVSSESFHIPKLGQRAVGTQTGRAWTEKAVDGLLYGTKREARAMQKRLMRALQKMYPNEIVDIEFARNFLRGKLISAPVKIIVPHWADFSKLYKQVAGLRRAGRSIEIVKVFTGGH